MSLCTSYFGLSHRTPILIAAIGLAGLINQTGNNPGPGERYGTVQSLAKLEHQLVKENPELATKAVELRANFDRLDAEPSEDQIRLVLTRTDACTGISPR